MSNNNGATHPAITECVALNAQFTELVGREAYQYTSEPKPGEVRMVFADGVQLGYTAGLTHMRTLLADAKAGTLTTYPYDVEPWSRTTG